MIEIVIASGNKGKIEEIQNIFKDFKIKSINDYNINFEVEEDQNSFEDNAIKKAETISNRLEGKLCMADDSGIEIEYLHGFPGVNTKRWHTGSDRERNLAILEKMEGVPREKRKIDFVTVIAVSNGRKTICEKGVISGYVSENVRGNNGFGFDEIFELENGKTLAELSSEEKNKISARKFALKKIEQRLKFT